jgi:pimeloyl-ACP methyl ester carboxylesterase
MLTDVDQLDLDGLRIAYRRAGNGPPVMLLHGFVGVSREWRREIEEVSDEFTVVAWDAPGSGGSSDPPDTFRLADFADCLAAFIPLPPSRSWRRRRGADAGVRHAPYDLLR